MLNSMASMPDIIQNGSTNFRSIGHITNCGGVKDSQIIT